MNIINTKKKGSCNSIEECLVYFYQSMKIIDNITLRSKKKADFKLWANILAKSQLLKAVIIRHRWFVMMIYHNIIQSSNKVCLKLRKKHEIYNINV